MSTGRDGRSFEGLDANGDGRVSLSEFTSPSGQSSRSFDGNSESTGGRSGASTGVDRPTMSGTGTAGGTQAQHTTDHFRKLDRDGDGYLSRNELNAAKRNSTGGTER
jgi:Ca2+-binding EF-hand superfamily protein